MVESRERPLDVLKSLLMTNVKPRVKAGVLDTLHAFAETPTIAHSVWMLLEVSGILSPVGLVVELTDESNYQVRSSFSLHLLLVSAALCAAVRRDRRVS